MAQIEQQNTKENVKASPDVLDEIDIYSMPENFRLSYQRVTTAKKTGMAIVVLGTLFFVGLSAAGYYYFFLKKPVAPIVEEQKKEEVPVVKQEEKTATTTEMVAIQETSREAYLRLRNQASSTVLLGMSMPGVDEIGEVVEEAGVSSSTAVLKVKTKNLDKEGLVTMIFDNGWRITSENWNDIASSTQGVATLVTIDFKTSPDADNDGLSDKEEVLLGLDKDAQDSDGDTYPDLGEMLNSYNPAGNGKLADNANVKKYTNNVFSYDILYPAKWNVSAAGGDESIIFRSEDNHFYQIIAQPNPDREDIQTWYDKQIKETGARSIYGANWEGLLNRDGLIAYITDKKRNMILTITYNPGEAEFLDYAGFFQVLVKNLNIN